jgi:hypothetical protein
VRHTCSALRTMRSMQRTPHIVRRLVLGASIQRTPCTMQRATSQCNMKYPTGRQDRWHTTCNMQHATLNATSFARHATSIVRAPCAAHDATSITHHATYNAPHATYSCSTHNCQRRGSRTAEERAMLPPMKRTDPPYIVTTPPLCTPPPHSASGPDRPRHATRTPPWGVKVSEIATDSNVTAPLRIASTPPSCTPVSMQTRSSYESPAGCAALSAIESASTPRRSAGHLRPQAYRDSLDARAASLHANKHSKSSEVSANIRRHGVVHAYRG